MIKTFKSRDQIVDERKGVIFQKQMVISDAIFHQTIQFMKDVAEGPLPPFNTFVEKLKDYPDDKLREHIKALIEGLSIAMMAHMENQDEISELLKTEDEVKKITLH